MSIDLFIKLAPLATGIFMIVMSFMTTTRNKKSSLLFEIIPFFLGLSCLFSGGKLMGWL